MQTQPARNPASVPVRLLCVNNGLFNGNGSVLRTSRHTGEFLLDLAARVERVTLAQGFADLGDDGTLSDFDVAAQDRIRVSAVPFDLASPARKVKSYLAALGWIVRETRDAGFVYLFLPGHFPMLFAIAARILRRPYGIYLRGEMGKSARRLTLGAARFALAASPLLRDQAARHCPRSDIVAPMIDFEASDVAAPRPVRQTPPWRLLFVGRLEPEKGIEDLLVAFRLLRSRGVDCRLDVVGGGGVLLEKARAAARAEDRLVVHGLVRDRSLLGELFRAADLLVLPTHSEGFPRVLYEAMIHGTPIATTFVGGIPGLMRDGENCRRIPVRDPDGTAGVIEGLLSDSALRERLAAAGRAMMLELLAPGRPRHAQQVVDRIVETRRVPEARS